jgi:hypothetical protein
MGLTYFSALLSGWFGPDSVRPIFLAGTFISEIAVAVAILAESKFTTLKDWSIAVLMVVGICLGVFFTLALFTYDESISSAQQSTISKQQSTIIGLDKALLNEQRITSRERMVLAWLVRAVAPRDVSEERSALVEALKDKGLGNINIAYVDKREPEYLAMQMKDVFVSAGIMGKMLKLPSGVEPLGSQMYEPTPSGRMANQIMWEVTRMSPTRIAGSGAGIREIGWESLPEGEDTLVIGENDAAFQAMGGQAGEGIDENARPLPP